MTQFEFLIVLVSIVVGFAVSEILSGWGRMIRFRDRVRIYWIHLGWTVLLVVLTVQLWWGLWEAAPLERWTFFEFLLMLASFLILVLLAFVVTPHFSADGDREESLPNGERDLRDFYYANAPWLFGLGALLLVLLAAWNATVLEEPLLGPKNGFRAPALVLLAASARSRDERFHGGVLVACYALLLTFILLTALVL